MPPHCDSLDGPVVAAARAALDAADVDLVLPFVHADGEARVRAAFEQVLPVRDLGPQARATADRWFLETVVRGATGRAGRALHGPEAGRAAGRAGDPARRARGRAGLADQLAAFLSTVLSTEIEQRLKRVRDLAQHRDRSLRGRPRARRGGARPGGLESPPVRGDARRGARPRGRTGLIRPRRWCAVAPCACPAAQRSPWPPCSRSSWRRAERCCWAAPTTARGPARTDGIAGASSTATAPRAASPGAGTAFPDAASTGCCRHLAADGARRPADHLPRPGGAGTAHHR